MGRAADVNASNVYVIDKTPPEYDYWKFFKYTHADYVDDKVILNDIQTVITGKPAGDPTKRDPEGKVFKVMSYRGIPGKTYWETLPEGPMAEAKEAVKDGLKRTRREDLPLHRRRRRGLATDSSSSRHHHLRRPAQHARAIHAKHWLGHDTLEHGCAMKR